MVHKQDFKANVVYLYQFPRSFGIPNFSPYCIKLETWLRMVGVEYEVIEAFLSVRSKEGTLPFIELNGQEYADSEFVIQFLKKELGKESFDSWLSQEQQGIATALYAMLDIPFMATWTWERTNHMDLTMDMFPNDKKPWIAQHLPSVAGAMMKKGVRSRATGCGIGRHSDEEIHEMGCRFLKSVSDILGKNKYIFGDKPCTTDVVAFSHIVQILKTPMCPKLAEYTKYECPNLIEHTELIIGEYWKDWDEIVAKREPPTE